jgi:Mg/Co/Ni transporter MgtE|tara:strand:- start:345 stop:458 length:114 start_codon:yes stop_codon:yes gene_type:complete
MIENIAFGTGLIMGLLVGFFIGIKVGVWLHRKGYYEK